MLILVDGIDKLPQDLHCFRKIVLAGANIVLTVVQKDVVSKSVVNEPKALTEVTRLILSHYVVG